MSRSPKSPAARRDWGCDDSRTPILHVDMDSFFVAVEQILHPELAGQPVIVGGSGPRSVVSSASYDLRARGVHAGMPVSQARRLAPQAHLTHSPHETYRQFSHRVMEVLRSITPLVEVVSIDEAFLDVSGSTRRLGSPTQIGQIIRSRIRHEVGLTASVGVAATKSVAKIASSHAKPDGMLLIPADRSVEFVQSLPVGALWGVGERTEVILERAGIDTVNDLAHTPLTRLDALLGTAQAHHLHQLAWGIDRRRVTTERVDKSMGTETTFDTNVTDRHVIDRTILAQSHECAERLRSAGLWATTVVVKMRGADFTTRTRSQTLRSALNTGRDIVEVARALVAALGIPPGGIRLIGVRVENLRSAAQGIEVAFDDDRHHASAEAVMDAVRQRFGSLAMTPAALMGRARRDERGSAGQEP